MKVSCSRSGLQEALRIVGGVVDPRNIKPILQDIRIRTVGDDVEISATDLEVGLKYFIRDAEVSEQGEIVVPVDRMSGIATETLEERLSMWTEESKFMIEAGGSRFHINGLPGEEFPDIPDFPEGRCMEIEGVVLREMIEKTIFAVALEKQRYALNGVLILTKERSPRVQMIGTDGRRLAMVGRKANSPVPLTSSVIIPVKALHQLQKMVGEDEVVKLTVDERQVFARTENAVLAAQLVEGRFPPHDDVIPKDSNKCLELPAPRFMNLIRQAAVLADRDSRAICVKASKESLTVESSDPSAGDAHVETEAKYEGDPIEIRFNPDYLLDALKVIGDQMIRIEMATSTRAALVRAEPEYLYLIMPITQD